MTAQPIFDTLGFVKKLAAAGMNTRQAEALAEALTTHAFEQLATKADVKELELRLTMRMGAMNAATIAILGALITFS
jgi:hypothetical protein